MCEACNEPETTKTRILYWIENLFLHTGYALAGDECCTASPRMTWLAKLTTKIWGELRFDDELEFMDTQTKVRYHIYTWFTRIGVKWSFYWFPPIEQPVYIEDADDDFDWNR